MSKLFNNAMTAVGAVFLVAMLLATYALTSGKVTSMVAAAKQPTVTVAAPSQPAS